MCHIHNRVHCLFALFVSVIIAAPALAEDAATVSVHGVAFKKVAPTHVRVRFRVAATGNSARSAISKIEADRKALHVRLDSLKGSKLAVLIGEPFQLAKAGRVDQPVRVDVPQQRFAFEVSLVWPMKAGSAADRLLQIDAIREYLWELELIERDDASKKDVAGAKGDSDKSGDEVPAAGKKTARTDEDSQMRLDAKPTYDYIYEGSESDWAELCKSAFVDARREADELASAAGRKVSELHSISNFGATRHIDVLSSELMSFDGEDRIRFLDQDLPNPRRATSDQLRPIEIRSDVYAVFKLN